MKMGEKLKSLYNTMCQIETKGNNTLIMSDCLKYLHQCIQECEEEELKTSKEKEVN